MRCLRLGGFVPIGTTVQAQGRTSRTRSSYWPCPKTPGGSSVSASTSARRGVLLSASRTLSEIRMGLDGLPRLEKATCVRMQRRGAYLHDQIHVVVDWALFRCSAWSRRGPNRDNQGLGNQGVPGNQGLIGTPPVQSISPSEVAL